MKNAIRILCLLLCVVMCLGIIACAPEKAENEIPQASGDGATDGEDNKTETPADDAEEKGCGGTVTVAGLALVAAIGSCAIFVEKKRK